MASVEIVTVGTELLLGDSIDTNSVRISAELAARGVDVFAKHSVGDNVVRLEAMVRGALERADGVVTTGGLGPTVDDITKEAVAAALDLPLERHEPSLRAIEARFRSFGRLGPIAPNNVRQAQLPRGSTVLPNANGTAPGFIATRADGKFVVCLPGPPREMLPMLLDGFCPWLAAREPIAAIIATRTLHTVGIGESDLDARIEALFRDQTNPKIAMLAHGGLVDIKIMAKAATRAEADALIAPVEAQVRERIGDVLFGIDAETLESAIVTRAIARGVTLATAESLTGGAVAERIVRVPGASRAFRGGIVAYDDALKSALLGVDESLLRAHGAVSEQVARAMALGACERLDVDYAVATTGIAGPTGATATKPVGLVWVAVAERGGAVVTESSTFPGSRDDVRRRSTITALRLLFYALGAAVATGVT